MLLPMARLQPMSVCCYETHALVGCPASATQTSHIKREKKSVWSDTANLRELYPQNSFGFISRYKKTNNTLGLNLHVLWSRLLERSQSFLIYIIQSIFVLSAHVDSLYIQSCVGRVFLFFFSYIYNALYV